MQRFPFAVLFAFAFVVTAIGSAGAAQIADPAEPYLAGAPKDGVFKVAVIGDSLAVGLHQGLTRLNKDRAWISTDKKARVNTGIVRTDRYDWNKAARQIARQGYQAVVAQFGLNDLQSFRERGKAYHYTMEGWEERYRERVSAIMSDLKSADVAVYWVGIPIVGSAQRRKDYAYLNDLFRQEAEKNGIKYVDSWTPLAEANGSYTPFWTYEDGKRAQIRARDGVHFTPGGYLIFAGFVNDLLLDDLWTARVHQAVN